MEISFKQTEREALPKQAPQCTAIFETGTSTIRCLLTPRKERDERPLGGSLRHVAEV